MVGGGDCCTRTVHRFPVQGRERCLTGCHAIPKQMLQTALVTATAGHNLFAGVRSAAISLVVAPVAASADIVDCATNHQCLKLHCTHVAPCVHL